MGDCVRTLLYRRPVSPSYTTTSRQCRSRTMHSLLRKPSRLLVLRSPSAFLRARFAQSSFVQGQFKQIEARIDSLVGAQSTPPAARTVWDGVKGGARTFHDATDVGKYVGGAPAQKKAS